MHRNIYERVEVMFRLNDSALSERIMREVVAPYLADTEKTRILLPDGRYVRTREAGRLSPSRNGWRFNAQQFLVDSIQQQPGDVVFPPLPSFLRQAVTKLGKASLLHHSRASRGSVTNGS
jgi:hypothetical protein